ncbi:MAG: VacJ family lipoprotein [Gammaproteobacteria bacterium]|jgi:phospholipid-binding lipoprotein MlaA|nr:VacJ family lipoprotein [Gammaproteobacteria bacterium]
MQLIKKSLPLAILLLTLSGCASTGSKPSDPNDPYQTYNQAMFSFNDGFYTYVGQPVNEAYTFILPSFARTGIDNFYQNLGTIPDMGDDLLQWNWRYFGKDTARLIINTTLGLLGLIDIAGYAGIPAHDQGFTYTLAKWGWTDSSYFVLPLLGPSTVSGTISLVPDYLMSPMTYVQTGAWRWAIWGTYGLKVNSEAMPQYKILKQTAVDPYVAMRDAYLQNRQFVIQQIKNDGLTPEVDTSNVSPGVISGQMSPALASLSGS